MFGSVSGPNLIHQGCLIDLLASVNEILFTVTNKKREKIGREKKLVKFTVNILRIHIKF